MAKIYTIKKIGKQKIDIECLGSSHGIWYKNGKFGTFTFDFKGLEIVLIDILETMINANEVYMMPKNIANALLSEIDRLKLKRNNKCIKRKLL